MFRRFLLIILIALPQYLSAGSSASHTVTIEVKKPTTVAIPTQKTQTQADGSQENTQRSVVVTVINQ